MDSIIFDLDGTLWDSSDVVVIAWNGVLKDIKKSKRNNKGRFTRHNGSSSKGDWE